MVPARVLVVDDSASMRQLLTAILEADPELEVVGTAPDAVVAREKIKALNPDVLTLDVEMPRMNGLTFLEKLMRARPMPVVMVSSLTAAGADATLRALELGAVDFFPKPTLDLARQLDQAAEIIREKVREAARARRRVPARSVAPLPLVALSARSRSRLIALGASTGGTQALSEILSVMPAQSPPMVVTQHMPAGFTLAFANRLNGICAVEVREAVDGDRLVPGLCLIAPGGKHLSVQAQAGGWRARVDETPPVNRHRPSVDVLFESCAETAGTAVVAGLLTGMGADGARGLLAIRQAGGRTLAQDAATSVVFGMPKEGIRLGGAEKVVSLGEIAGVLLEMAA